MTDLGDCIAAIGVVPVRAIESLDHAVPLADALLEGVLPLAEITFRTKAAADMMHVLRDRRADLLVGAGTVLDSSCAADDRRQVAIGDSSARDLAPAETGIVVLSVSSAGGEAFANASFRAVSARFEKPDLTYLAAIFICARIQRASPRRFCPA